MGDEKSTVPDWYAILGLEIDADVKLIGKTYRKLALKHHPDRGGDSTKFQTLTQAYETLSDLELKSAYDKTLAKEIARKKQAKERERQLSAARKNMRDRLLKRESAAAAPSMKQKQTAANKLREEMKRKKEEMGDRMDAIARRKEVQARSVKLKWKKTSSESEDSVIAALRRYGPIESILDWKTSSCKVVFGSTAVAMEVVLKESTKERWKEVSLLGSQLVDVAAAFRNDVANDSTRGSAASAAADSLIGDSIEAHLEFEQKVLKNLRRAAELQASNVS